MRATEPVDNQRTSHQTLNRSSTGEEGGGGAACDRKRARTAGPTFAHERHHDPQLIAHHKGRVHGDDVWVAAQLHDAHLPLRAKRREQWATAFVTNSLQINAWAASGKDDVSELKHRWVGHLENCLWST